ncbi:hypothetical protein DFA_03840 [Cavenderia fasciculata]|uniref:Leucine-rich repeat-containing protein n=1 Tax=Cavenderia fasciculata TaxID=261658 RepID=F4Q0J5_CACFS|nr:uncharacterized protein DFA_03840 [Cavenderia fasciculata]EGG18346.1 hypothetical protein DFA_03840 [Cavenderia fasciculata]|eukprot:XP_004366250.1 hypothetical protein DFA_03840 [Cavenderia fasciculata]
MEINNSYTIRHPIEKRKESINHSELINGIALVSRWWLHVVRQSRTNLVIKGPLEYSFLHDTLQSDYSIYSFNNIQVLDWQVLHKSNKTSNVQSNKYKEEFKVVDQLIQLLPQLKIVHYTCENAPVEASNTIVEMIRLYSPQLEINIDLSINGVGVFKWPLQQQQTGSSNNNKPNHTVIRIGQLFGVYQYEGETFTKSFYQMLDMLKPSILNLCCSQNNENGPSFDQHVPIDELIAHLSGSIKHINFGDTFIKLSTLSRLVNCTKGYGLESIRTVVIPHNHNIANWNEICSTLSSNNTRVKRLDLKRVNLPMACDMVGEPFASIWATNTTVEFLRLTHFDCIGTTSLFYTNLCHNQTITKLMLTHGTIQQSHLAEFSLVLSSNTNIVHLDINSNYLQSTKELVNAFKTNKSIRVLNIMNNQFTNNASAIISEALLESDTVQYLFLDRDWINPNQKYFKQSKSLKEYYQECEPTLSNHIDECFFDRFLFD